MNYILTFVVYTIQYLGIVIIMNTEDLKTITNVAGPKHGPINHELIDKMYDENIIIAYDSGNKYVKKNNTTISVSWDIH